VKPGASWLRSTRESGVWKKKIGAIWGLLGTLLAHLAWQT